MNYFFDTNAILTYLRDTQRREWIDTHINPLSDDNTALISVVVLGELESIATRNNWGEKRKLNLEIFLGKFVVTDINSKDIITRYAQIDAFSQGKLKGRSLKTTARNMGKNDLWIAATASVTSSSLISSDKDFLHLKDEFIDIVFIEL